MIKAAKVSSTSARLREAIEKRKISQAELARRTGLGKGGISNYATGRYEPKNEILYRLAEALDVSEMWLWGYDVPMDRSVGNQIEQIASSSERDGLSKEATALLELFNQVPPDQQEMVLSMIRAALGKK